MDEIAVGKFKVGKMHPPLIIAEMSGNHNRSLERALEIVDAAGKAGAHALKIQTYTAETMTLNLNDGDFKIEDPKSLWNGRSLYELYDEAHTPWEWHRAIFDRCNDWGMLPFSTPFDDSAVNFLEELGVACYKVASFEITDLPLIRRIAQTGKPVLVSTGMASVGEIEEAVKILRAEGNHNFVLLKCTSTYPALPTDSNISTISHLKDMFACQVGLSDHTLGVGVPLAAVALGASVIEKHFTLSRDDGGVDSAFSLEPFELKLLVEESLRAWQALGHVRYGASENEKKSLTFRRSLYASEDIEAGENLSAENVRIIRPGYGLAPKHFQEVIGRKAKVFLKKGTPLKWGAID